MTGVGFDEILERRRRGSLKLYLGYAAGVGKTFAMLQEGNRLKQQGFDVVVGYLEPHDRPETWEQLKNLECVSKKNYVLGEQGLQVISADSPNLLRGRVVEEMDLDAILARRPQIVLIDELAHSNMPGSLHAKRYEDVLFLLQRNIHVIATLNVQHLESIADKVGAITRVEIHERVPDALLRECDQIVNVDVAIDELRQRLRLGKVYDKHKAETALGHFFTPANLSMLRETALREAAGDQLRKIEADQLLSKSSAALAHDTVMVAMSSDPTDSATLIRKGTKLAAQLSSLCVVVYVQRPVHDPIVRDLRARVQLQENFKLAQSLGARVVTLKGQDVAQILVNYAHDHNVRHAVFGKSRRSPLRERIRGSVILDFIHDCVGIDVHIVTTTVGEEL